MSGQDWRWGRRGVLMLPVWLTLCFCSSMSVLHTYQFALTNCLQQTEPVVLSEMWLQSKARHWTLHCLCCLMVRRVSSSVLSSWRETNPFSVGKGFSPQPFALCLQGQMWSLLFVFFRPQAEWSRLHLLWGVVPTELEYGLASSFGWCSQCSPG